MCMQNLMNKVNQYESKLRKPENMFKLNKLDVDVEVYIINNMLYAQYPDEDYIFWFYKMLFKILKY